MNIRKRNIWIFTGLLLFVLVALLLNKANFKLTDSSNQGGDNDLMDNFSSKINISINGDNYTATLEDNRTTRELVKRLPIVITMDDLNQNEKYYYLDKILPVDAKKINKVSSGDIMLYGSDCLVIFYESFDTSYSYTKIGKIDDSLQLKEKYGSRSVNVTIGK